MARRHAVGCGLALLACIPAAVSGMRVLPSIAHPALRSCAPVACAPAPVDDAAAATGAKEEELSPQQAVKELGSLFEQVKAVWVEGKTWSADERVERRRAIVTSYVRVFAPAVSFSGVQLSLSLGWLAFLFVALSASGLGYDSILSLTEGLPPLHDALGAIDPGWGNLAIALVGVEVSAPVLIPLSAFLTPPATKALQGKLDEWGLDADGLNKRIEKVLRDTS